MTRPAFVLKKAEELFPGALASFPGGNIASYRRVCWSFPTSKSEVPDGILVLPHSSAARGYLYYQSSWRKL